VTPETRLEALAMCDPEELEALADELLAEATAEVLAGPEVTVAPLRVPGAEGEGSVVVARVPLTRCTVSVEEVRGDAIVPGRSPRGALAAALLDAEVERGGPRAGEVERLALRALERRRGALAREVEGVAATRIEADA
jgi:alpha-D-ribose 1-methylphosphonate 5-triphosphate synthase subunit PhnG